MTESMWHVTSEETERGVQALKEESLMRYNSFMRWAADHGMTPMYEIVQTVAFNHDIWFSPQTRTRFFEEPWLAVLLKADNISVLAIYLDDDETGWAYFTTTAEQARLVEARWKI